MAAPGPWPVQRIGQTLRERVRAVAGALVAGPDRALAAQAEGVGSPVHRDAMEQADGSH
jgi:hypothetical protein